ncbi:MAG: hypothetical protein MK074_03260 [Phycisphaerales bacterium]|nr:hypothetical protein [Phycisphaerales bacterium]
MLYGGVDEAGYGPMLGPLCVGATCFDVPHTGTGRPCLWSVLDAAVCPAGRDKARRIAIDDSKKLKGAKSGKAHPLANLERGVLCMLASMHDDRTWLDNATDVDVLHHLGVDLPDEPWFGGPPVAVPLGSDAASMRIDAARLARAMHDANVSLTHCSVRAMSVPEFNARVASAGSKSWVNFELATQRIETMWSGHDGALHVVMDRHGGRTAYQRELHTAWPQSHIEVTRQDAQGSDYTLARNSSSLFLHIRSKADSTHLPVALASMAAKLVRELLMHRLNRYFSDHLPAVAPTAGYVQDGRRWLKDVQPVLESQGVARETLVRAR